MIFTSRPFALSALQHWSHFGPSASRAALYREVTPHEKHLEQEFILMGKPRIASPGCRRAREELTGDGGIHFQCSQNEHSPLCNKAPSCSTTASRENSRVGLFFTKRYVTATEIIWWVTQMLKFVNKQHSMVFSSNENTICPWLRRDVISQLLRRLQSARRNISSSLK